MARLFGTDGVRGLANGSLTAELALDLSVSAAHVLAHCPACHGFYGASSMERLPVEAALTETTRRFTQIKRSPAQ